MGKRGKRLWPQSANHKKEGGGEGKEKQFVVLSVFQEESADQVKNLQTEATSEVWGGKLGRDL